MYNVKVQRFDWSAAGNDVALPFVIENVGRLEGEQAANEFAEMWSRYDNVAAVWVERQDWVN